MISLVSIEEAPPNANTVRLQNLVMLPAGTRRNNSNTIPPTRQQASLPVGAFERFDRNSEPRKIAARINPLSGDLRGNKATAWTKARRLTCGFLQAKGGSGYLKFTNTRKNDVTMRAELKEIALAQLVRIQDKGFTALADVCEGTGVEPRELARLIGSERNKTLCDSVVRKMADSAEAQLLERWNDQQELPV